MAPANPELRELIKEMNRSGLAARFKKHDKEILTAEGEIFPSAVLPVLATGKTGGQHVFPMKWGFAMKNRLLINARAETAAEKPVFIEAWYKHRCIIPVTGYFEWEHDKRKRPGQKYILQPETPGPIWLAGLYRMEDDLPVFVILTRPADETITWMHDRMPVMLSREDAVRWIRPDSVPEGLIKNCLTRMTWRPAV